MSAAYTSQASMQKRFTTSEVAADWHEPMMHQRNQYVAIHCPRLPTIGLAVQRAHIPLPQSVTP